jgi:SanA protein
MKYFKNFFLSFIWADGLVCLLSMVMYCWFAVSAASAGLLFEKSNDVPHAPAALVLGTSQWRSDGSTNYFFLYRMEAAARLYHAGKVKWVVVSGDNHTHAYDEPRMMREALIKRGVPACRILSDYAGFRTFDSVVRMKNVFGFSKYIIVSQQFHNQRAVYLAHKFGHTVYALNARDVLNADGLMVHVREAGARVKAWLDIHILGTEPRFGGPKIDIGPLCN